MKNVRFKLGDWNFTNKTTGCSQECTKLKDKEWTGQSQLGPKKDSRNRRNDEIDEQHQINDKRKSQYTTLFCH